MEFEGNIWRILRFDSTGIKIISEEAIVLTGYSGIMSEDNIYGRFDGVGLRDQTSNGAGGTYCLQIYGCNVWSKINGEYVNGSYNGTVLKDSELNIYLNNFYYNNVLKANLNIINSDFNIGPSLNETSVIWNGHIGLLTDGEYTNAGRKSSYLNNETFWWLITPYKDDNRKVFFVKNDGKVANSFTYNGNTVRPVLYLSPNITLTGNGTNDENIYKIVS